MSVSNTTHAAGADFLAAHWTAAFEDFLRHAGDILTDSGSANAYVVTCNNVITALSAGQVVKFVVGAANTGSSTLRFKNSASLDETDNMLWEDGTKLRRGELPAGAICIAVFDGSDWRVKSVFVNRWRSLVNNLKAARIAYERLITTAETGGSAGTPNFNHYLGELEMSNSSAEDLVYAGWSSGFDENASADLGPIAGTSEPFSVAFSFRLSRSQSSYDEGFCGFRSAYDCPGSTDTAHHAGFIMDGTDLYASVGNGTSQTKSSLLSYPNGITEYSVFKVEFDGTDWKFYIDDMDTAVATLTTTKPTISSLAKVFVGIDSNNQNSRDIWVKKQVIFEAGFKTT